MLSIADKPILQYVVESLANNGIRDIVVVVGYRKEQVYDYFGAGERLGIEITYVTQEDQLGTAHALEQAKDAVGKEFLVLPGDNLIAANTIARFATMKPTAILAKRVANPVRYGVLTVERGKVRDIVEKPKEAEGNRVNTGIYAFNKQIFDFIEPELDIPSVLNKMISQGHSIGALETGDTWLDVVYPWDILSLNDAVLGQIHSSFDGIAETNVSIRGRVAIGKDTVIRSNSYIVGPAVIGAGCDIGPNACILPATSIGDNVVISPFTEIKNSVIGNDISIGAGGIIEDSVIDRGCVIRERFTACSSEVEVTDNEDQATVEVGAMIGEGCSLENNVVARSGTIMGNYCQVKPMKSISERLPDGSLVF